MANDLPATWLAVESLYNWEHDRSNGFMFTGVADTRQSTAKKVRKGDYIFVYVKNPIKAFVDVRRATEGGLQRSPHTANYEIICAMGIRTELVLTTTPSQAVKISELTAPLKCLGYPPRTYLLRNSFRSIVTSDGVKLLDAMKQRSQTNAVKI
jgi:hypothetical protein